MAYWISEDCTGCTACQKICPTGAIQGSRGERHAIQPERCIDCGACGRICPSDALLAPSGEMIIHQKRSAWVKPVVQEAGCISCGICVEACPVSCLDWATPNGKKTHVIPYLSQPARCLACAICAKNCPMNVILMIQPVLTPSID